MNAQTYAQAVIPVLAILAAPKYRHQQSRQQQIVKRMKKRKPLDSLFQTACDANDASILLDTVGCYGKDAKPVVGNVSSFNRIS